MWLIVSITCAAVVLLELAIRLSLYILTEVAVPMMRITWDILTKLYFVIAYRSLH